MAVTTRTMDVPHVAVMAVLRDGASYARWVVGTREITAVEEGFPAPGTALSVRVGPRFLSSPGRSLATSFDPGGRLSLRAAAVLVGAALIDLEVTRLPDGGTRVSIDERPERKSRWLPVRPAVAVMMFLRNVETLRRLEAVARERVPAV